MDIRSFPTRLYVSDLDAPEDFYAGWHECMPQERQARCSRFKFEADRKRCIMAYALLVHAIRDLGIKCADTIAIGEREDRKPYLCEIPVFFNISHAKERVAVAVSSDEVGCDVECKNTNALSVAKRFFASREYEFLRSLPNERSRSEEFTRLWTMKESVIKCCGEGIRRNLNDFVCIDESGAAKEIITLPGIDASFYLREYEGESGYRYSVCAQNGSIENMIRRISLHQSGE